MDFSQINLTIKNLLDDLSPAQRRQYAASLNSEESEIVFKLRFALGNILALIDEAPEVKIEFLPHEKDIHTEHCCQQHKRCKYGKEETECSVAQGVKPASRPCNCEWM